MKQILVAAFLTAIQILFCLFAVWVLENDQGLIDMANRGPINFVIAATAMLSIANFRIVNSWET